MNRRTFLSLAATLPLVGACYSRGEVSPQDKYANAVKAIRDEKKNKKAIILPERSHNGGASLITATRQADAYFPFHKRIPITAAPTGWRYVEIAIPRVLWDSKDERIQTALIYWRCRLVPGGQWMELP